MGMVGYLIPVIPGLGDLRQQDLKFMACGGHTVEAPPQKLKTTTKKAFISVLTSSFLTSSALPAGRVG